MFNARMSRNEVKKNVYPALVSLLKNTFEVFVRAVSRSGFSVIGNIIACISERGFKARVYPYRITAKLFDIIELFNDAVKVADTVTVRIIEEFGDIFRRKPHYQAILT